MSLSTTKTRDYPKVDPKRGVNYLKTVTSTTYTITNEDKGFVLLLNPTAPITVTLAALSIPIGSQIDFVRLSGGANTVTFAAGSNSFIRSKGGTLNLTNQYTGATIIKISDTEWFLTGDLS
jgi:hypothetical protein